MNCETYLQNVDPFFACVGQKSLEKLNYPHKQPKDKTCIEEVFVGSFIIRQGRSFQNHRRTNHLAFITI